MKKYGKTDGEVSAGKSLQCREIVKEIIDFGVDEYQKMKIIELLALELESRECLKSVTSATKKYLDSPSEKTKKLINVE